MYTAADRSIFDIFGEEKPISPVYEPSTEEFSDYDNLTDFSPRPPAKAFEDEAELDEGIRIESEEKLLEYLQTKLGLTKDVISDGGYKDQDVTDYLNNIINNHERIVKAANLHNLLLRLSGRSKTSRTLSTSQGNKEDAGILVVFKNDAKAPTEAVFIAKEASGDDSTSAVWLYKNKEAQKGGLIKKGTPAETPVDSALKTIADSNVSANNPGTWELTVKSEDVTFPDLKKGIGTAYVFHKEGFSTFSKIVSSLPKGGSEALGISKKDESDIKTFKNLAGFVFKNQDFVITPSKEEEAYAKLAIDFIQNGSSEKKAAKQALQKLISAAGKDGNITKKDILAAVGKDFKPTNRSDFEDDLYLAINDSPRNNEISDADEFVKNLITSMEQAGKTAFESEKTATTSSTATDSKAANNQQKGETTKQAASAEQAEPTTNKDGLTEFLEKRGFVEKVREAYRAIKGINYSNKNNKDSCSLFTTSEETFFRTLAQKSVSDYLRKKLEDSKSFEEVIYALACAHYCRLKTKLSAKSLKKDVIRNNAKDLPESKQQKYLKTISKCPKAWSKLLVDKDSLPLPVKGQAEEDYRNILASGITKEQLRTYLKAKGATLVLITQLDSLQESRRIKNMKITLQERINRIKKLQESENDDLVDLMRFDMLDNTVFLDLDELRMSGLTSEDFKDCLYEVLPTWAGIDTIEKARVVLQNSSKPEARDYLAMLNLAAANVKAVEQDYGF